MSWYVIHISILVSVIEYCRAVFNEQLKKCCNIIQGCSNFCDQHFGWSTLEIILFLMSEFFLDNFKTTNLNCWRRHGVIIYNSEEMEVEEGIPSWRWFIQKKMDFN